jgi:hypothetical protein
LKPSSVSVQIKKSINLLQNFGIKITGKFGTTGKRTVWVSLEK